MARFLADGDYDTLIKAEIKLLLDGRGPGGTGTNYKLLAAENMAMAQIKNRLMGRYDMVSEFAKTGTNRDAWLMMAMIDITLYHLYSQVGTKDLPKHREDRYNDIVTELRDIGTGVQPANLAKYPDDTADVPPQDMRLNSDLQENHKW